MSHPVLICGSVAFDTIAVFEGQFKDHFLPEKLHAISVSFLVPSMRRDFGGCAGNIAYGMSLLGGHPVPVATVGEDAGDYIAHLQQHGVDVSRIKTIEGALTAQCYITTDLENNQITAFHPGAMAQSASNDLTGAQARWAIVAPDAKDGMFAHATRLKAAGIPFVFDLGQAMPLYDGADMKRMIEMASALTVNDYEAGVVESRCGQSIEQIALGLQAVVVTRGAAGATLFENGTRQEIATIEPVRIVDPTGCGDAHRAGLLHGLTQGWSWADSCKLGNVMGTLKIGYQGPQGCTLSSAEIAAQLQSAFGVTLTNS